MKKILFALVLTSLILSGFSASAQYRRRKPYNEQKEKKPKDTTDNKFWDKVMIGGNAWAAFSGLEYIEIMPLIGYKVTDKLQIGIGPSYVFRNYMNAVDQNTGDYGSFLGVSGNGINNSAYGGRIYIHYNFIRNFFVRGEIEELNTEYAKISYINDIPTYSRRFVPATLLGGGIQQQIGERSFSYLMLLYDITYDPVYSYNPSPFRIVAGFMF